MLVHDAGRGRDVLLDFFVAVPGLGLDSRSSVEMEVVDVPFGAGDTTQRFFIGPPSCAVPGTVAGIAEASRLFGSLPWPKLLEPAIELARAGVELNPVQGLFHEVLDAVLRNRPEGRRVWGASGPLRPGDRLFMPDLAGTLALLASEGADAFYRGELARRNRHYLSGRRRPAHRAGSRRVPGRAEKAGSSPLPRARARLESAAVVRRSADRLRAPADRPAGGRRGARQRRGDRPARGDGARDGAGERRELRVGALPRGARAAPARGRACRGGGRPDPRGARRPREGARGDAVDDAHQRDRRSRQCRLSLRVDGDRLRLRRTGHRHPAQQHARRARPQPFGCARCGRAAA